MPDTTNTPFDPPLPGDWARGIDVAVWQQGLDWAAIAQAGFGFAFVKATEGDDYTDPAFAGHWQAARDHGLLRGAYHFFWPEDDHEKQARLFVETVKQLESDDLPPIIDVEARPKAPPFPNEQWVDGVRTWLDIVENGLGRRPMIYTSPGEWAHLRDGSGLPPTWTARYPLWVAHWDTAQPALPDGWDNWFFWQYKADSVPGFSRAVDYDVFRGSRDDLRRWLTGSASGPALTATAAAAPTRPSFPLRVSYINQIESDGSGHDNCGPCCLTMALSSIGQVAAAAESSLRDIMHRVSAELKGTDWSTPVFTDFDGMGRYLDGRRIAHRALRTWQSVEQTLDAGQPVILRLWNGALEPYAYGAGPGWVSKHFIVLLGYTDTAYYAADPLTFPRRDLVQYTRDSVRRAVARVRSDAGLSFEVDAFVVGDPPSVAPTPGPMLIDPIDSAISDAQLQAYLEQYLKKQGQSLNMDSAIMRAAALAYRRGETRGPALSLEYNVKLDSGQIVSRQDFTASVAQRDPQTNQVTWLEVVLHPDELKREHLAETLDGRAAEPEVPFPTRAAGFVRRENGELRLDGQPFKFVGVNTRELLHYGNHAIVPQNCNEEQIGQQLDAARLMKASVARVFLAHRAYDPASLAAEVGDRLAAALDIACGPVDNLRPDAVRLLVAFTDYNSGRGYYPRQDEPFFNPAGFLEGADWYNGQWRANYWPLVEAIVGRFKNDPRIFAWEVGNELKLPADPETFLGFMTLVTSEIKKLDPNHLVGAGIISTLHCAFDDVQAGRFYANPNLDFATLHLAGSGADYPHLPPLAEFADNPDEGRRRAYLAHELALAGATAKPLIVEEAGYLPPEMPRLEDLATYAFTAGAVGFLPWGFSGFPDQKDRDVGDNRFGLGNFPPHFDAGLFDQVIHGLAALVMGQFAPGGDRGTLSPPPKKPGRRRSTRKAPPKPPKG
ncbi:MAG: GH25 family lysozyme [Anaerolineae bacterium]